MLSRLNLPVTVATLLVASVYGTGVSHAGQAVGTPQANLVFTPPNPTGVPGEVNVPSGQGDFRYSLCEGRILGATEVSRRCTRSNVGQSNLGPIIRGGNQASYVFAVPADQTLPEGVSIDGFGILHVAEDARLDQTVIRVCVRQLNVNDSCQNIGLNQRPPLAPGVNATAPPPAEGVDSPGAGGGNVIVPLAIAGGAGVGGWMILDKSGVLDNLGGFGLGGSCSPADPSPGQVCLSGQVGGSACQTAQSQQNSYCQCEGFSGFDNRTGGCR